MDAGDAASGPGPMELRAVERRVLGALVEKSITTPDAYPLTTNAVIAACNQKSARDPVSHYEAHEVDEALLDLKAKGLVLQVFAETGRTARWRHNLREALQLDRSQTAVLAELFLRGPQTEGDLRSRASRMAALESLEALRELLDRLASRGFVRRLSPEGRRRGVIWGHLFLNDREKAELDRIAEREAAASDAPDGELVAARAEGDATIRRTVEKIEAQMDEVLARLAALEEKLGTSPPQAAGGET